VIRTPVVMLPALQGGTHEIGPAGQPCEGDAGRLGGTLGRDIAFLIESELLAQKEVLCCEGVTGVQAQEQETHRIDEAYQQRPREWYEVAEQARVSSHGEGIPLRHKFWSLPIIAAERRDVQSLRMEFLRSTGGGRALSTYR
jgi:hypothetical protein